MQQKKRRVPLGRMGKGLLVIITDSQRNTCDTTKCDHKKKNVNGPAHVLAFSKRSGQTHLNAGSTKGS